MKSLNLHQVVWYFFIYSILGMFLENIFCFVTSFQIESRKGLIIGPFCPIYGVGAILLSVFLNSSNRKYETFIIGLFIGSIFEYISSFALQAIYGVKFWDYSHQQFNLNGRTSLLFAVCWGILSLLLIYFLNPKIDKIIQYFEYNSLDSIIIVFMCINVFLTYSSLKQYINRVEQKIYNNSSKIQNDTETIMTDEVMEAIFPNVLYVINSNKTILVKDLN